MERLTSPNINVDPDTDRFLHATIGGKEIDWKQCRDSTLNVLINGPTSNGFGKDIFRKMVRDLYGRLKAYEDTGLTPKEVTALGELFDYALKESKTLTEQLTLLKHIRELAEADKDGRLVVPPCKVGDMLYEVTGRKTISVYKVKAIRVELFSLFIEWDIVEGFVWQYLNGINANEIGKTVFLTREEAEKALRKIQGKENADGATDKPE